MVQVVRGPLGEGDRKGRGVVHLQRRLQENTRQNDDKGKIDSRASSGPARDYKGKLDSRASSRPTKSAVLENKSNKSGYLEKL